MAADTMGAGEQALRMAPPRSRLAVLAATRAARGYVLRGDRAATERNYDHARELLGTLDDDPDSPCPSRLNETPIALSQAQSWTFLGDYHRAVESFQNGITELPSSYRRGRGVYVARAALALAGDREGEQEGEQAAILGRDALAIGAHTRSGRILTDLARLDDALTPWNTVPTVADFRTAMKRGTPPARVPVPLAGSTTTKQFSCGGRWAGSKKIKSWRHEGPIWLLCATAG
ncbi:MAG: hypothetical protein ACRDTF_14880 [Pseudonocardiaceae bacterium]